MAIKTFTELWPLPYPEIVVVTGGFGVGKSTFTLGTGAAPERTFVVDFEKSQKAFSEQLPIVYKDVQAIMEQSYPKGYKMIDLYRKVNEIMDGIEPGKYDVIVLDNASNLEDAIVAYVEANPTEFGHSQGQYNSMSGLKWGDVKSKYQQLLTRWVSKAHMIFIIVHLKDKWVGNSIQKDAFGKPVQEPKGKETLDQLSSLFVWLEAGPGAIPAARVLKCRLDRKVYVADPDDPPADIPAKYLAELNGEPGLVSVPVLPLRLPKCTWAAIREYMRNPADLSNPQPGELPTEAQMSDDDRLKLRAIIADREAEKMNGELARLGQLPSQNRSVVSSSTASANRPAAAKPAAPVAATAPAQSLHSPREASPQGIRGGAGGEVDEAGVGDIRTPDQVKAFIAATTQKWAGKTISDGKRGVIVPVLETIWGDATAKEKRYQVQKYLTGKTHMREMTDPDLIAIYLWLEPAKDTGGQWSAKETAAREARAIVASLDAQPGQQALFEDPDADIPEAFR
jgi:hypothetical protein